jgi:hypothetical protein
MRRSCKKGLDEPISYRVKMQSLLFISLAALTLAGCTDTIPSVSSLGEISLFATKSESPFRQEVSGRKIFFKGNCVPTVTGFKLRVSDNSGSVVDWNSSITTIPSTPPTPDATKGEFVEPGTPYDIDCSDGRFDFYVFFLSYIPSGIELNKIAKVELKAVGAENLPVMTFQKPQPSSLGMEIYGFHLLSDWSLPLAELQNNRDVEVRGRILAEDGKFSSFFDDIDVQLSAKDLLGNVIGGSFYSNFDQITRQCAGDQISDGKVRVPAGNDEFSFCFKPPGLALWVGSKAMLEASYSDTSRGISLQSGFFQFILRGPHNVIAQLQPSSTSATNPILPPVLVRGITYKMAMSLVAFHPFFNASILFSGKLKLSTPGRSIELFDCPTDPQSLSCIVASIPRSTFRFRVPATERNPNVNLQVSAEPAADCTGTTCQITVSGTTSPIAGYYLRSFWFPVVDGNSSPAGAGVWLPDQWRLQKNLCQRIGFGMNNGDGTPIPPGSGTNSISIQITSEDIASSKPVRFYNNWNDCNNDTGGTAGDNEFETSVTDDNPFGSVIVQITNVTANGKVIFKTTSGAVTRDQDFFVDSND